MLGKCIQKKKFHHLKNPDYHYFLIFDENNHSFEGFMGYENGYEEKTTNFTGFIWFLKVKEKVLEKKP
jgi:hypothetical protein